MINTHKIKLELSFCDSVLFGDKCFEVRFDDRGYQKGDFVCFIPVEHGIEVSHPISKHKYIITYVLTCFGIENGYVVFGIREVNN